MVESIDQGDETVVAQGRGSRTTFVDSASESVEKTVFTLAGEQFQGASRCNVLLRLGADLLALLAMMPRMGQPVDINRMRDRIQGQLVQMRSEGGFLSCHPWALEKTGLVLSAALDEAVLKMPWGKTSGWANDTLLSRIYGLRNGGDLFYQLLEQARLQPEQLIEFLELQYVLLRLGFVGRYHDQPGHQQSTGYELFRLIQRASPGRTLECRQMPSVRDRVPLWRFRFGRIALFTGAVILIMLLVTGGRYVRQVELDENSLHEILTSIRPAGTSK